MKTCTLKHLLWNGDIRIAGFSNESDAVRMFNAIMPVSVVNLNTHAITSWVSFHEDCEIEAGIAVGDIVDEELDLHVPMSSLVIVQNPNVVRNRSSADASYQTGQMVAQILTRMVDLGDFGVRHETTALYALAKYYAKLSRREFMSDIGLLSDEFRMGMAAHLARAWSGTQSLHSDPSGFFTRPNFLETNDVRSYLSEVDPNFVPVTTFSYPESRFERGAWEHGKTWMEQMIALVQHDLDETFGKQVEEIEMPNVFPFNR